MAQMADRTEMISGIRRVCIKANPDLWNDHGDILKRRIAHGVAVPTKLGLADILMALSGANDRRASANPGDEDEFSLGQEQVALVVSKWNVRKDDINEQDDACISAIAGIIL